jgi:hypothetical protein
MYIVCFLSVIQFCCCQGGSVTASMPDVLALGRISNRLNRLIGQRTYSPPPEQLASALEQ